MSGYIGVNGVARKIKKVYVGVDGVAREVKKMYVGDASGIAREGFVNRLVPRGTILKMNLDGEEKYYRVLDCSGSVAFVVGMFALSDFKDAYNTSSITTTAGDMTIQKYEGSNVDTYLNTTWYNALNSTAKAAIIPTNIIQDVWYSLSAEGSPDYNGTSGSGGASHYTISKYSKGIVNINNRNIFSLSIQDIIDYLSDESVRVNSNIIYRENIWKMFWNTKKYPPSGNVDTWLRSGEAGDSNSVFLLSSEKCLYRTGRYTYKRAARPAFYIDISKITYTIASPDIEIYKKVSSYTVDKVSGATYGFTAHLFSDSSQNYYESTNKGVANSAAVCRVNFNLAAKSNITFSCLNYAESNYDFGILGNVDTALGTTSTVDSSYAKSFKGLSSSNWQTYTYTNVAAGTHFIDVKFRKDSSADSNNDSLRFKITIANA